MAVLTYRGKTYIQHKEPVNKKLIELTYRRNVYSNRQKEAAVNCPGLTYRGIKYKK